MRAKRLEEKKSNRDAEGHAGARVVGGSSGAGDAARQASTGRGDARCRPPGSETLMYMEREERSGPDYHPTSSGLMKWASQRGSIYVGDQKLCVEHPGCAARRVRSCCERMSSSKIEEASRRNSCRRCFEECLPQVRRDGDGGRQSLRCDAELGVSAFGRGHGETAEAVLGSAALEEFPVFAMYLDTVHRDGQFVVALGVDREGKKLPLGFWDGATRRTTRSARN